MGGINVIRLPKPLLVVSLLLAWARTLPAVETSYRIDPLQFPNGNTVRLTLLTAPTNAIYKIEVSTNLAAGSWTTIQTGAVGQLVFDLPRPAASAVFYRAQDPPPLQPTAMFSNEVARVMAQALTRANFFLTNGTAANAVIAVVDREGFVLGVRSAKPAPPALDIIDAITKAGTASFLSSDQHAFSSRTAGFIVQQHFPPGILNRTPGPLVGVNFSNMSFTDVNRFKDPSTYNPAAAGLSGINGAPVTPLGLSAISGLAGSPGGVPLFRAGRLIGGVAAVLTGQTMIPALGDIQQSATQIYDVDEDVALAGELGFQPDPIYYGDLVFIDGISVPYLNSSTTLETNALLGTLGLAVPPYNIIDSPYVSYPTQNLGGVVGEIRSTIIDDPLWTPGSGRLTVGDVTNILALSAYRSEITRAGIRLPAGQPAQTFICVVNNPGPGAPPVILGTFRTPGATLFSWDVAVQKARSALYFSSTNRAYSTRTIGFLAQQFYPPGIDGMPPGPYLGMQEACSLLPSGITNLLNGVVLTTNNIVNPALPNGLTIFPGGFPLYRDGQLIGAIGVSGDGVDQDDLIAAAGTVNFLPPPAIRADQFLYRGTRLPYAKFPRNPSL